MAKSGIKSGRRLAFGALLFVSMGVSIFAAASLGIMASFIIDEFGISRTQLGIAIAVINIGAAVLSPLVGRLTDRVGGRTALLLMFAASAVFYLVYGLAPAYFVLLIGGLAGAIAQASANPATNKLIAEELPVGQRSLTTGVKQSGVQAGIFLGALIMPSLALAFGWRVAYLVMALAPVVLLVATLLVLPARQETGGGIDQPAPRPMPRAIGWLATYGFLMGFSGAVTFLVPLYSEEVLGFDPRLAGAVAAWIAVVAAAGRIGWGRYAEASGQYRRTLALMGVISVGAATTFWLADAAAAWLIWIAAGFIALGSSSWNSVGMLSLMADAGPAATGRASGVVLFGFLAGLGIAPPLLGALVDQTGSYDLVWVLSGLAAAASVGVIALWARDSG